MLFNKIWRQETIPDEWTKGVIFPIFKNGDVTDCGNYRGITLMSIISKIYGRVINNRILQSLPENGIVEEQGGFRSKRGCIDQIFALSECVRKTIAQGEKMYIAFIDIKKAYDRVWRNGLWKRLWDSGIKGKLWRVIKKMYEKVENCVLVDGELTEWFENEIGLKQGDVLSPLLYSLFINGFAEEVKRRTGGIQIGEEWLKILLFADDIALISESPEGLQEQLNILYEYSKDWRFEINAKKSQVMICEKGKQKTTEEFYFGKKNNTLTITDHYKYLGVILQKDGK